MKDKIPPSIYFGGCSFGSAFYVGIFEGMVRKWGRDFYKHTLLCGGSAGTIMALGMALGKSPKYLLDYYNYVGERTMESSAIYFGSCYLEEGLRRMLADDPMAYKKIEGRFCLGTTTFFSKFRWHLSWESNEDLINCVKASYHVPLYCKRTKPIKGIVAIDGAYSFSGSDLPHGDDTLFIGIDPYAEVSRSLTKYQMFSPSVGKECEELVISGIEAFEKWDGVKKEKVGHRIPNYPALYVLWFCKVVECWIYFIPDLIFCLIRVIILVYETICGSAKFPKVKSKKLDMLTVN